MPNRFQAWWQALLPRLSGRGNPEGPSDLKTMLSHFQAVLDCNNQALEVMTDMGEKLGGDYLFDVNYTQRAYDALSGHIGGSLRHFALLTGGRYPHLGEVQARLDVLVRRMLTSAGPPADRLVLFYDEITWDLAEEVGGKNYHLAELRNSLKLPTPAAFALTTAAFDLFVRHNNRLAARLQDLGSTAADIDPLLPELQELVRQGSFPEPLAVALEDAVGRMRSLQGQECRLAVRSSAEEEDGDFSFAGQFGTVLNVPCTLEAVQQAYKEVVASLFGSGSIAYQRHLGYDPGKLRMAVGCVAMIEARVSGVTFTASDGNREIMLVSAAWGLGKAVVDGFTDADLYRVRKGEAPEIIDTRVGRKEQMVVNLPGGGIETVDTPAGLRGKACLTEGEVLELARQAMLIEEHFRTPQDIEWAIDAKGRFFLLQSRSLRLEGEPAAGEGEAAGQAAPPVETGQPVLLRNQGLVVQKGTAAGPVFILRHADELDQVPQGAVLVARNDSPHFVRVIPFLAAIITDVGVPTSHMASICRELGLPTVVNAGNATALLPPGQEVTLRAGEEGEVAVHQGILPGLLRQYRQAGIKMRELYELRRQKYIMRYIAPLHLVNPLEEEFAADKCRTIHDLIRFMHEKSVQELVAKASGAGRGLTSLLRKSPLRRLQLPIPVQLLLIDIGGGVSGKGETVEVDQVLSPPLRGVLRGMTAPGVWHGGGMALRGKDLLAGITRAAELAEAGGEAGSNLAIISGEYLHLSLRFGYHFNVLDSYCSGTPRNNHIYFRFVGGAAAITSRSRRIQLMADVLAESGFILKTKGDLLIARLSNLSCPRAEEILEQVGRLIAFTRQLDAVLDSDEMVARVARDFLAGRYTIPS